ncbi:SDR family oxidoreductase [Ammoniphilus sp. YIM 78166]|uniref:SDR family NAD(P)-dependent oxidoreductase n=1 Tax=Ammoniphilus sp. YIM 78166 TaxID=1644106 RepID=UPI0010700049|nr:SDR family oxidoreductase [Ammoniphilus sp. YIM 78166]
MSALNGRVILITGAGTGLGRELALQLAEKGAKLILCGRRKSKLSELQEELEAYNENILALPADVSQEQDVKSLVRESVSRFGRIDMLINNAAVFANTSVAESSLEEWNYQIGINLTGTFLMSREVIPQMRKQKSGQIINFTSGLAKTGADGFGAYSASKAAIETLTYSIEEEEQRNGISALVINPGIMKTNMQSTGVDPAVVAAQLVSFLEKPFSSSSKVLQLEDLSVQYQS